MSWAFRAGPGAATCFCSQFPKTSAVSQNVVLPFGNTLAMDISTAHLAQFLEKSNDSALTRGTPQRRRRGNNRKKTNDSSRSFDDAVPPTAAVFTTLCFHLSFTPPNRDTCSNEIFIIIYNGSLIRAYTTRGDGNEYCFCWAFLPLGRRAYTKTFGHRNFHHQCHDRLYWTVFLCQ
jgi:hypothetical protein